MDRMPAYDVLIVQRFWSHVSVCHHGTACDKCCWPWLLAPHPKRGSGKFYPLVGQGITAPRFMWAITTGTLPAERRLYRRCPGGGHAACVNSAHFSLSLTRNDPQYDEERREQAKRRRRARSLDHQGRRTPAENSAKNRARRARKLHAPLNDFTAAQWQEMQAAYGHRCVYCDKLRKGKLTQDHIIPLSTGGSHTARNIVPACRSCNSQKGRGAVLKPIQPVLLMTAPAKT
jgi:5-methylcytosine-specific restriction endonuclease McrA